MKKHIIAAVGLWGLVGVSAFGAAQVYEMALEMKTYPFSDPDPVPATGQTRYPYFFFDGTTDVPEMRTWKAVILENDKVKVTVFPEIGGKVWGAVDKVTGREFVYYNHVVKFRNISQRGPWCSGGIEFNFGIIGHGPWTATPVSYVTRTNADGSVSCFVSETELVTRTTWQVEICLPAEAEGFLTRTQWYNGSGFPMPYYQWMNAAYSVRGNPSFEFPGTAYIGHGGLPHDWPIDPEGHDLHVFAGNAFGGAKSEHIVGGDSGIYGIWWPEAKFGSAHLAHVTQKYGRKVWLWPLSRNGGIWEDLLTDEDGQYTELQSGRVFNQPSDSSYLTPFKHPTFAAGTTDAFEEEWRVVRDRALFDAAWQSSGNAAPRPLKAPKDFDWTTPYGLCLRGEQRLRQKMDRAAEKDLLAAVEKDANYAPALSLLASLAARHGEYARARAFAERALAVNTYDAEANYADGLACWAEGRLYAAKERFGLAAYAPQWRAAAFAAVAKIELAEGNWAVAETMAEKVLDADRRNPEARLVQMVAARRRGDHAAAGRIARETLAAWPLFHAARYELNRAEPTSEPFDGFVRNELPQETYMEIGTWYEAAGQGEDAAAFFARAAERTMIGAIREAYVLFRLGQGAAARARLDRAAAGTTAFALPFRRETLPALDWAVSENASWKFAYLKAVLLAGLCRDAEAKTILCGLGEVPDDSTFYLYRAGLVDGDAAERDLNRALKLGGGWRAGLALGRLLAERKDFAAALKVLKPQLATGANKIKIAYANALVGDRRYREAITFLETNTFLPSEHGDNASSAWIDAGRALAEEALAKGDRAAARAAVRKALSYPEHLGVGKPYELDFRPGQSQRNPLSDWSESLRELAEE